MPTVDGSSIWLIVATLLGMGMGTIFTVIAVFIHHTLATRRVSLEAEKQTELLRLDVETREQEVFKKPLMLPESNSVDALSNLQSGTTHSDDQAFLHKWQELVNQFDDTFSESSREVSDSWQQLKEQLEARSNSRNG